MLLRGRPDIRRSILSGSDPERVAWQLNSYQLLFNHIIIIFEIKINVNRENVYLNIDCFSSLLVYQLNVVKNYNNMKTKLQTLLSGEKNRSDSLQRKFE